MGSEAGAIDRLRRLRRLFYFADPDGHVREAVVEPRIEVGDDKRTHLPD
jgi:hypothetical protein